MKNMEEEKLLALLSDLKHEYEKAIGWSSLSEKHYAQLRATVKQYFAEQSSEQVDEIVDDYKYKILEGIRSARKMKYQESRYIATEEAVGDGLRALARQLLARA